MLVHFGVGGLLVALPFLACSAVIGAAIAAAASSWTTLLQRGTPDALRGRIFAISSALGSASLTLGMALAGFTSDRIRFGMIFGPGGIMLILMGILLGLVFAWRRRRKRARAVSPYRVIDRTGGDREKQKGGRLSSATLRFRVFLSRISP